jgi:hypothetical protein
MLEDLQTEVIWRYVAAVSRRVRVIKVSHVDVSELFPMNPWHDTLPRSSDTWIGRKSAT